MLPDFHATVEPIVKVRTTVVGISVDHYLHGSHHSFAAIMDIYGAGIEQEIEVQTDPNMATSAPHILGPKTCRSVHSKVMVLVKYYVQGVSTLHLPILTPAPAS